MTDEEVEAGASDAKRLWPARMRRMKATINSLTDKEVDGCMGGAKHLRLTRKANNKGNKQ
jgi:hypothetical protein